MIHSKTGMQSGVRYTIERRGETAPFTGFFLDGMYYFDTEAIAAAGWLEGQQFICEEFDAPGERQAFPDRHVGIIEDLTLTLESGESFKIMALEA